MALTIMNFYEEKPFYRYRRTKGNPLTPILQVLIAAIRKRDLSYPSNPALLCEKGPKEGFWDSLAHSGNYNNFIDFYSNYLKNQSNQTTFLVRL